ncbi:hypothetical protein EYR36_006452 [Pleurotus pulmonarius]|nr:hypothetical protein EYR36_006452 [Pleurotus pulmonarius]
MSSENMDEKKQTTPRATPQISEIESRDIPTAVESWRLAFENDPLRRTTPEIREPTTIIDRILDWTIVAMTWTWGLLRSAELRKRRKEVLQKITSATERVYGDRVKSMVHIDGLATSPQSQGRGYAGALLDAVTAKADAGSRATYLESSNVANTGFYESHGFRTIEEIQCGDDNPAWKEPPVVVKLSYVIATSPELREPTTVIDRALDWTVAAMTKALNLMRPAEWKKRRKEVLGKIAGATERLHGDRVKNMYHIDSLATSPQSRCRGYASALLDAVTAKADAASRGTYLQSSNVANTAFYESRGFRIVGEVQCGNDNPAWKQPPVVVKLMVREHDDS